MQFKETLVRLLFLLLPVAAFSQTTYLPQDARENVLLERMEILRKNDSLLQFSKTKPFGRRTITQWAQSLYDWDSVNNTAVLAIGENLNSSKVDQYNLQSIFINNLEWTAKKFTSKKTFLKTFYKTPANFYEVNVKDFFLAVNPIFQYYVGKEKDNDQHIFLNTRGIAFRGRLANKIGFAGYITDNQERDPLYVQQFVTDRKAVPGQGFYKEFKETGYDYFDARGYFTFNAAKYIDFQFGYDKNFIGNGYRSLFLSDFSAPYLFLKLNTRIWKFNYQNLFMELNTAQRLNADQLFPKKYAAMHHLDMAITKWLNVGLFEGVIFGRNNHFEFGYLNPIIFYRSLEQQNGSYDNAVAGFDFKANVAKKFQFYGQLLMDEFNLTETKNGDGWWANKYGFQLGAKYIDAFNIRNLDLQLETNRVRPFTYSHRDSVANYTHYNQALAHPLGANFQEVIGTARYQPAPRWFVLGKVFYTMQGKDTVNALTTSGSNIFKPNVPPYRQFEYGYEVGSGIKTNTLLGSLLISYEWKPNFFLELNTVLRNESPDKLYPTTNTAVVYFGVRWNMQRRDFEF